jgi:hypothetical protein
MKKILSLYLFIFSAGLFAAGNEDLNIEALKEWIATKRALTVEERGGALSISGDVHVEYIALSEQRNGYKNIGSGSYNPLIAEDQFDIEFNFAMDFRTDITWGSVKVEFDNNAGIANASFNSISLERAFFGMRLAETDDSTTDLEFGRRFIGYTFDSQIQFGALMDGILLKYNRSMSTIGDFYLFASPFIVDELKTHISFVAEIGLLNIGNTGFYTKYSLIDWATKNYNNKILNRLHNYINSQFLLGYRFKAPFFDAVTVGYAAFLVNSAAKPLEALGNRRDNLAGYIGFQMGEIRKKNDWSMDFNMQIVEPQSIPYKDFTGIGITDPGGIGLFALLPDGSGIEKIKEKAISNGNYYGASLNFLYAIENSLTLVQSFSISRPYVTLPKKFYFQKYKIELVYAW